MLAAMKQSLGKFKLFRSFRARIFIILFLVGTVSTSLMRYGFLQSYIDRAISVRTSDVQNQMQILANHLITYNYLEDNSSEVINAELDLLSNLYDGRVLIVNQGYKVVKDTYGLSDGKTIISEEVIKCFDGESINTYDEDNHYIEITTPIAENKAIYSYSDEDEDLGTDTKVVRGVMLVSVSTDSIVTSYEVLQRKSSVLELIILSLLAAVSLGIAILLQRPLNMVKNSISQIDVADTQLLEPVNNYLETEYIMNAFNQVLGRMKVLNDSRQEFVSNVSHELKTPITSMKVLADSLLTQEDVPNELYREFMVDITAEIDRENKIINDLLALVKLDKTASELNVETVNINEMLELILRRLRPIARAQNIEMTFESMRKVVADVDEVKLSLAFTNLVENAIKYNKDHGFVKVTLDADHQFFVVEVTDSGIGIPEENIDRIYERFYRVDKSHSREIGGTGLGLAITRSAILMHRGSIKVTSVLEEGTTFTVKIPISYIA